jgi:peptidyl-prolyl cis-trans isomerase B (cyclophilin B)
VACELIGALAALGMATPIVPQVKSPSRAVSSCAIAALRGLGRAVQPPAERLSRGVPSLRWASDRALPERVVIVTHRGELFVELYGEDAPAAVASVARLATQRFYRGLRFHRVEPGFVVQVGDPQGTGWGGPGYTLPCELSPRPFVRGSVGLALAGRDTGGSQFFITLSRQPHLDGRFPLIGRVVKGMDVAGRLQVGDEIKDLYVP